MLAHLYIISHILSDTVPDSAILTCTQIDQLATTAEKMVECGAFGFLIANNTCMCACHVPDVHSSCNSVEHGTKPKTLKDSHANID